jgi:hypothetical protein
MATGEPEDPVKGEGAVEIAHPNTDVIDPLDIDGLAHPTPPRWKPETMSPWGRAPARPPT